MSGNSKGEPSAKSQVFSEALNRLVSVPRAEMQKRIAQAPKESVSRHKRYKYVPAERPAKP